MAVHWYHVVLESCMSERLLATDRKKVYTAAVNTATQDGQVVSKTNIMRQTMRTKRITLR